MARKKKQTRKRKPREEEEEEQGTFEMNPETKRGILVIALFALSAILFLSFFDIAGSLGVWINTLSASFFGWDRFLLPILLIIIGATIMYPERGQFSGFNYLGFFFFFLSFNALLNLLLINNENPATADLAMAGGRLGQFLGVLLPKIIGFWGAIVATASLLLVSILLIFNTSLRNVLSVHQVLAGWFGGLFRRREGDESDLEEEEDFEELEEDEEEDMEIEEADEEETDRKFGRRAIEEEEEKPEIETVLTSKGRKRVIIPLDLLIQSGTKANSGDIEHNKEVIRSTFEQFGINVEMGKTSTGPTVTQFTLRPAKGVKLSRIVGLQNDLALSLAAHPIRIEAPIPGKSLVGIEVPNQRVATVTLREVLESKSFKNRTTPLTIPLGKDVSGEVWSIPLEKMPHMLVAGATGSGKSVALNTIIVSFLYQNGPDDLRFILIDPKRVEMNQYQGIPHLLVPPITKVDDAVNALKWTVREMERRLDILAKFGARDILSYNERAEEKMPKIVVIIDELSDLMSVNGRDIEPAIVRIAQMSRAAGIHLILATQRPSVDVITGLIKANFPARIAFAVASQTDSRTILDVAGADKLLGRGDMLFTSADVAKPKRLQGAFLSETEVRNVVSFLKKKAAPDYNYAITETQRSGTVLDGKSEDEPLLEEAIAIVVKAGKASTSYLQRRLKIGYSRAARIMDIMEDMGVIGASDGSKSREVLVDQWPQEDAWDESQPEETDEWEEDEEAEQDGEEEEMEEEDEEEETDEEEMDEEEADELDEEEEEE